MRFIVIFFSSFSGLEENQVPFYQNALIPILSAILIGVLFREYSQNAPQIEHIMKMNDNWQRIPCQVINEGVIGSQDDIPPVTVFAVSFKFFFGLRWQLVKQKFR